MRYQVLNKDEKPMAEMLNLEMAVEMVRKFTKDKFDVINIDLLEKDIIQECTQINREVTYKFFTSEDKKDGVYLKVFYR